MIELCEVRMREKTIEQKLIRAVKAMGGISPKLVSPGTDGMRHERSDSYTLTR